MGCSEIVFADSLIVFVWSVDCEGSVYESGFDKGSWLSLFALAGL